MPPKKTRNVCERKILKECCEKKFKEDIFLISPTSWSKEQDSVTAKWVLTCKVFWWFCFAPSLERHRLCGRHRGRQQNPLGSIWWGGKEDLIQEYFRYALWKQRPFHPPLLNLAQNPPKGNRAPTVRSVYFLLSWKAKVLLPLKGVTSIHQRKKWPIKAVKLVLFLLHKSTSFLYIKRWV